MAVAWRMTEAHHGFLIQAPATNSTNFHGEKFVAIRNCSGLRLRNRHFHPQITQIFADLF
jgi:hypothetical protein